MGGEMNLLTVQEAADYLKVSKQMIYKLTMMKEIPHYKIGARCLFDAEKLKEWMNTTCLVDV